MSKIVEKIDGTLINPTVNLPDLEIEVNFDRDDPNAILVQTIHDPVFEHKASLKILAHIKSGENGGVGAHEGLGYTADLISGDQTTRLIDDFIDTTDPDLILDCNEIAATTKPVGGLDQVSDIAGSAMYQFLFDSGAIPASEVVQVPYKLSSVPNYREGAILILTTHVIISEVRDINKEVQKVIAEISSVVSAISGILKAVVVVLWIIATIILLVKLILDIKNALIQGVKYHAAMRLETQLKAGATAVGKTLTSTIFNNPVYRDTLIIPKKFQTGNDLKNPIIRGFTTPSTQSRGYFDGSFSELMAISKDIINGKVILEGNVMHLERRDANPSEASFQLDDIKLTDKRLNANELNANVEIEFRTDLSEENTIDQYEGTRVVVTTKPTKIDHPDRVLLKGKKLISNPFALVKTKKELSTVEKVFSALLKVFGTLANGVIIVINALIKLRNAIINRIRKFIKKLKNIGIKIPFNPKTLKKINKIDTDAIDNTLGIMVLSSDYFQEDKIATFDISTNPRQTKPKATNETDWSALEMYKQFYFIDSHVPQTGNRKGDQWIRYSFTQPGVCYADLLKMIDNNYIFTHDNKTAKIETMRYKPKTQEIKGTLRIQEKYTDNLEEIIHVPNGF